MKLKGDLHCHSEHSTRMGMSRCGKLLIIWQVATSFIKIAVSGNIIRFGTNIYGQA